MGYSPILTFSAASVKCAWERWAFREYPPKFPSLKPTPLNDDIAP